MRPAPTPAWLDAEPVELPFGYQPLRVEYESGDEPARLSLFWEGPGFALEPLGRAVVVSRAGQNALGRLRARRAARAGLALRGLSRVGRAARSVGSAGARSVAWQYLAATGSSSDCRRPTSKTVRAAGIRRRCRTSRWPLTKPRTIAAFLITASAETPPAKVVAPQPKKPESGKTKSKEKPKLPSAADGATLVRSLGCLACHRIGELGSDGLFGGGDLSQIAAKRPAGFFARWLVDPAALNSHHRMPVFALDALEVASLSLYLESLGEWQAADITLGQDSRGSGSRAGATVSLRFVSSIARRRWQAVSTGCSAAGGCSNATIPACTKPTARSSGPAIGWETMRQAP